MSGFSADWLALREPFDAAARSQTLIAELSRHLASGPSAEPLEIVDLGAGAGSNLRYLAPLLGGAQRWRLVDHDPALLEAATTATAAWAVARGARVRADGAVLAIDAAPLDLTVHGERRDLAAADEIPLPVDGLVTAAALLDLVSADWLARLARRCRDSRAAIAFALTYDGRTTCTPSEPEDAEVLALFNRHQLGDKGFGPALGPDSASATATVFTAAGYNLATSRSDWVIDSASAAMQHALLDGWLGAALEIAPARHDALTAWHERRRAHVDAGRSALRVGHVDVVGWL